MATLQLVGTDKVRIVRELEQYLRRLAARRGHTFGKIRTERDQVEAFVKTLTHEQLLALRVALAEPDEDRFLELFNEAMASYGEEE
jgi:hypothetical protein